MTKTIDELHEDVMEIIDRESYPLEDEFENITIEGNSEKGDELEIITLHDASYYGKDKSDTFEITIERGYKQRGTEGEGDTLEYIHDMNYEGTRADGSYMAYGKFLKAKMEWVYEKLIEDYGHIFDK